MSRVSRQCCAKCCVLLLRRANYPRQFGGVLPGLPGLFTACGTRCVFTAHGTKPTVSPLMIPLVYCHINSFQRASSMGKPLPGGEKRIGGQASHHEESE